MMATRSAEEIRIGRAIKSGQKIDFSKEFKEMFSALRPYICPVCKQVLPILYMANVRGRVACLRCQYDFLWDFTAENRRRLDGEKPK